MTAMDRSYETRVDANTLPPVDPSVRADHDVAPLVREVVGVFHDVKAMEDAIEALLLEGFDRATISLIASEATIEEKLRHRYDRVSEVDAEPHVPRMAYVDSDSLNEAKAGLAGGLAYLGATVAAGAVVFTGGAAGLAVAAAVAAGGGGALIGALLGRYIGKHHADTLQRQLDQGGLLLWVACADTMHETRAMEIMRRYGGTDVGVHELPRPDPTILTHGGVSYDTSFMNRLGL
jgi:hypothetical protein